MFEILKILKISILKIVSQQNCIRNWDSWNAELVQVFNVLTTTLIISILFKLCIKLIDII